MREKVSTMDVRARLGDMLNRVDLRMQTLARRYGLERLESLKGAGLSQAEADELTRQAVRWARRQRKTTRPK